jgi:hypothetical protein
MEICHVLFGAIAVSVIIKISQDADIHAMGIKIQDYAQSLQFREMVLSSVALHDLYIDRDYRVNGFWVVLAFTDNFLLFCRTKEC